MPNRVDDPTIRDDEVLWRRIIPVWLHATTAGEVRPASIAFIDRLSGELSVHLASLANIDGVLSGHAEESVAAIAAAIPRSLGYALVRDPTPEDPSHALICPSPRRPDAKKLATASIWIVLRQAPSA
jgi:hypothetical protein